MRQYLTELLILLVTTAIATTVGVLILTNAGQHGLPHAGTDLDVGAVGTAFVVFGILDGLVDRLWSRGDDETETADV